MPDLRRAGTETRTIADRECSGAPSFRRSLYRFVGDHIEENVVLDLTGIAFDLTAPDLRHGIDPSCVEIVVRVWRRRSR
jgi:hypothetical protein